MKNKKGTIALSTIASYGFLKLPINKIDPYTRSAIGITLGFGLALYGAINKNQLLIYSGIGIGVGGFLTIEEVARLKGAKIISNQFKKTVYALHETEGVRELKPNEIPNYRIDGLTFKGMNGVFKAHDSVYLKILSDGTIQPTFGIGRIVNYIDAGLKSKEWANSQQGKKWSDFYEKSI